MKENEDPVRAAGTWSPTTHMAPPRKKPIGLQVIGSGRLIARAFDEALAAVGGSLADWLELVSVKGQRHGAQHELAAEVHGPTSGDHLHRMHADGLVRLSGDPQNPSDHQVELTAAGEAAFNRYLKAVVAFDRRLRAGTTDEEIAALDDLLGRLRLNVSGPTTPEVPS